MVDGGWWISKQASKQASKTDELTKIYFYRKLGWSRSVDPIKIDFYYLFFFLMYPLYFLVLYPLFPHRNFFLFFYQI
jgi:hypothetical protein